MNASKYTRNYFMPPQGCLDWTRKEYVSKAPIWCSVDLRDGNQALVVPMNLREKIALFQELCRIGFKEIEVGFPAASDTEYAFTRALIEEDLIPDDVTIQVLTQARDHIIDKTFEALHGAKRAIVHVYNSTSLAQREQVFRKSREEIIGIARHGAERVLYNAMKEKGDFRFEYSPESFTGTEMEFALAICNAVLDVWQPAKERPAIINLPATVSMSMPHVYAQQIEFMHKNIDYRQSVVLSQHPHNDRGCAVADAELGLLAGAQRIEGTLFGNGERTGNVDIVTLALNMFSHGVDPELNLADIPATVQAYEKNTRMQVDVRHPYGGALVFAAFSGSHQDAIAKGMQWREEEEREHWSVPYLLIDPKDIGREYEGDVIRINSQSGKGGISYILDQYYGLDLPTQMRESFGYMVKEASDHAHKELMPEDVYAIFEREYVNVAAPYELLDYHRLDKVNTRTEVTIRTQGEEKKFIGEGKGRLDAINHALQLGLHLTYSNLIYKEHALEIGAQSRAIAYIGIVDDATGQRHWGVGIDSDIMMASAHALVSAINRLCCDAGKS